jgi:branched-chain amino acid transport system permease protein
MTSARDWSVPVLVYTIVTGLLKVLVFGGANLVDSIAFLAFAASLFLVTQLKVNRVVQLLVAVLVLFIGIPYIGMINTFYLNVVVDIAIYAALALGLNVVVGFAGLLDLGYIAFFATGAYLWGIFASGQANNFAPKSFGGEEVTSILVGLLVAAVLGAGWWFSRTVAGNWIANLVRTVLIALAVFFLLRAVMTVLLSGRTFPLPGDLFFVFVVLAVVVAACVGALLGLPVLKVKGDYLAIITLGLGEVIRVLANNLTHPVNITNGPQGITPIQQPLKWAAEGFSERFGLEPFRWELLVFYIMVLVIISLAVIATGRLDNSKIGRAWVAIREDEVAAQAMGVPLVATKLIAFATGASFAGAMGVVFAAKQSFISPESFDINQSIGIVAMVVLGGLGSIQGALLGAVIVKSLEVILLPALGNLFNDLRAAGVLNLPSQFEVTKYQRLIFGVILILMMIYRPQGLLPAKRRAAELAQERGDA